MQKKLLLGAAVLGISAAVFFSRQQAMPKQPEDGQPVPQQALAAAPKELPWNLIVVNAQNPLPREFQVPLVWLDDTYRIDARIEEELRQMLRDAASAGIQLKVCSAYRSVPVQRRLYEQKTAEYQALGYAYEAAQKEAGKWVAPPGCSEHHTGLTVDIVSQQYQALDDQFSYTAAYQWLKNNVASYGFIERYPLGKEEITGISFEPWHFRYVGKAAAEQIAANGTTLEEYIEIWQTAQA